MSALLLIGSWDVRPSAAQTAPIPQLAQWQSQMVSYGQSHCDAFMQPGQTVDQLLGATYYDLARVMYQIAGYTGQSSWNACAAAARAVYGDGYVIPNNGGVPGYWNFSTGLWMDFLHTGYANSQVAVIDLSENAAYAADGTPLDWTVSYNRSREVAYTILSYINAGSLGQAPRQRRIDLVNQAYGHMSQWFVTFDWVGTTDQMSPFMVGLTAHTLIRDWEQTQDTRLLPALRLAADWLWAHAWDAASQSMFYNVNPTDTADGVAPAPDLNLLVAPMYAFLYWQTGETKYRDQGDVLFAGGVTSAWLVGTKQFNQNYWWSFDYVKWRQTPPVTWNLPDTSPPTITIVSPAPGFVERKSIVTLSAATSDNVGVVKVEFYVSGTLLCSSTTHPYTCTWSVPAPPNKSYVLQAKAYDAAGNTGVSAPVTVVSK